jgi:hypothetical protein
VLWRAIWLFLDAILLAVWWLGIGWLLRDDHLRLSRLSLTLAAAAAVGAAANVAGLNLIRDVLLGVLFTLWTAWWISLLVVFSRQSQQLPPLFVVTKVRASRADRRRQAWRQAAHGTSPLGCGSIMRRHGARRTLRRTDSKRR